MVKRDKLKVIYDILTVIRDKQGKIKPTHILYKANLSHKMLDQYLNKLISKNLIEQKIDKTGKTYLITHKGYEYINKYKLIKEFTESFGLE